MIRNQKGFSQVIIIVVLLVGIVAMSAFCYYLLKSQGQAPISKVPVTSETLLATPKASATPKATPQVATISNSTDTKVLEKEINDTSLSSFDSDINSLNASAGSL